MSVAEVEEGERWADKASAKARQAFTEKLKRIHDRLGTNCLNQSLKRDVIVSPSNREPLTIDTTKFAKVRSYHSILSARKTVVNSHYAYFTIAAFDCFMQGVCGEFKPGRICAIMGSSGAGKTTVMNLITGKVEKTEGTLYVNGEEVSGLAKYRKLVGFVPQEDVMIRELTVRDNISFSAKYRLPVDLSKDEVDRKMDACIRELGIPNVQPFLTVILDVKCTTKRLVHNTLSR